MNTEVKKEQKLYRGSEWGKWDLQVHSFLDPDWSWPSNYPSDEKSRIKRFSKDLISHCIDKDISVIAITDHNSGGAIDGLLAKNQELGDLITILPGVEIIGTEGVHLICIFDPTDRVKKRWATWQETIEIFLSEAGVPKPRFGNEVKRQNPAISGESCDNIIGIAKEYSAIVIFPHSYSADSGIFKRGNPRQRKRVFKLCNILDLACDISNLENRVSTITRKIEDYGFCSKDYALINTSDSKSIKDIGSRFTWIKADPTFEGLKQIRYEPEERVSVGVEDPRRFTYSCLESFEVENDSSKQFFIRQNNPIYFNPGLNVLIGARGSGKSVFHDSLALSLDQSKINPVSYVSNFLKENKKSTLACCINTKGGSAGQFVKYKWKGEKQTERFLCDYFFQKKIGKIAEGRTEEEKRELSKFIFEHIFAEVAKDALETIEGAKEEASSKLKRNRSDINSQDNLIDKEADINEALINFKNQLTSYSQKELGKLYDKRAQIIDLQNTLKESRDGLTTKISRYKDFLKRFDVLSIKEVEKALKADFISGELKREFKREFSSIVARLETSIETPPLVLKEVIELLESFEQKLKLDQEYKKIEKKIYEKSQELNIELDEELDSKILKIQDEINKLKLEQKRIVKAKELKKELIKQREGLLKNYLEQLNKAEGLLRGAFESFCEQDGEVLKGSIRIDFYKDVSNEDYIEIIEKRKSLPDTERVRKFPRPQLQKIFEKEQNIQSIINIFRKKTFKPWEKIAGVGPETPSYLEAIENTEEIAMLLEETLPLLRATIQWRDQRGNYKALSECSVGERSTAVLSVILVSGRTLLLIDQPEDDLDNFYIFDRLIPIIKTVKKRRQLIFATHDANIVINADAELILILKSPDGKHAEIEPATIENMEKRRDIITILEGGAEAFARREKKLISH